MTGSPLSVEIGRAMAEGRVGCGELFVTTRLAHPAAPPHVAIFRLSARNWNDVPTIRQRVPDDFERSKEKPGPGALDLVFMHGPGFFNDTDAGFAREARLAVWEAFESLQKRGDALAIGVCNFAEAHLGDLFDAGRTVPAVNQIELHPYCQNPQLVGFFAGITASSWRHTRRLHQVPSGCWRIRSSPGSRAKILMAGPRRMRMIPAA